VIAKTQEEETDEMNIGVWTYVSVKDERDKQSI